MRVVAWLALVALCLTVAGCSLFGRKPPWRTSPVSQPGPAGPAPATPIGSPPAARIGLLAGRVVDGFDQKPPKTYIQVIDPMAPPGAAPINVVADDNGYFTIQGLEEKKQYKLVARARDGERLMAGNVFATTSHGNLVIKISEDTVPPGTPDVPGWPGGNIPKDGNNTGAAPPRTGNAPAANWSTPPGGKQPVELGIPTPNGQGGTPRTQIPQVPPPRTQDIANGQNQATGPVTPPVRVNPLVPSPEKSPPAPSPPIPPPPPAPAPSPTSSGANRPDLPSCSATRFRVNDFALFDVNGKPWQYQTSRRGQLLLIDFWGPWCGPCVATTPDVVDLYNRYSSQGLDVVGIAYSNENDAKWDDQVSAIRAVQTQQHIPYTLLVGDRPGSCPVKSHLGVGVFPTLILVDQDGTVVWRHEGRPSPFEKNQLAEEICRRLGVH